MCTVCNKNITGVNTRASVSIFRLLRKVRDNSQRTKVKLGTALSNEPQNFSFQPSAAINLFAVQASRRMKNFKLDLSVEYRYGQLRHESSLKGLFFWRANYAHFLLEVWGCRTFVTGSPAQQKFLVPGAAKEMDKKCDSKLRIGVLTKASDAGCQKKDYFIYHKKLTVSFPK